MTAAETYAALIEAVSAQRLRIHGHQPQGDRFGSPVAQRFRADPHRSLDANLQPEDQERARDLVEAHFHELFAQRPEGFRPLWYQTARQLLITWETDKRR